MILYGLKTWWSLRQLVSLWDFYSFSIKLWFASWKKEGWFSCKPSKASSKNVTTNFLKSENHVSPWIWSHSQWAVNLRTVNYGIRGNYDPMTWNKGRRQRRCVCDHANANHRDTKSSDCYTEYESAWFHIMVYFYCNVILYTESVDWLFLHYLIYQTRKDENETRPHVNGRWSPRPLQLSIFSHCTIKKS